MRCGLGLIGIGLSLVGGIAVGVPVAWVYAHAQVAIPVLYVNVMLCFVFGAVLGAVPAGVLRRWSVERSAIRVGVVILCSVIAQYAAWVTWVPVTLNKLGQPPVAVASLVLHPDEVLRIVRELLATGTWSIGLVSHARVQDTMLLAVWIIEAIVIFGMSIVTAQMFQVVPEENETMLPAGIARPS